MSRRIGIGRGELRYRKGAVKKTGTGHHVNCMLLPLLFTY